MGAYLDARLVAAIDVLKHRWQAPVREKGMSVHHILLERIKEVRPSAPLPTYRSQKPGSY